MRKIILLFTMVGVLSSCMDNTQIVQTDYTPGDVLVGIKNGTDMDAIFDLINTHNHEVVWMLWLDFKSNLPIDKLFEVKSKLQEKSYLTNNGLYPNVFVDQLTNQITASVSFYKMHNETYQNDWLSTMTEFELSIKQKQEGAIALIYFKVPVGSEIEWIERFRNENVVEYAGLNQIVRSAD